MKHSPLHDFDPPLKFSERVPLSPYCTLGVGGPAQYLLDVRDMETARLASQWARQRGLPIFVLGGGSNLVVADEGFPGLVLRVALRSLRRRRHERGISITVGAGETWDEVVEWSVAQGLAGIERLAGIPGSSGATPVQNVGAYGQQVSDALIEVEALDLHDGSSASFRADECGLGYRTSRFKDADKGRYLILSIKLLLHEGESAPPRHAELSRLLQQRGADARSPRDVRSAVIELRRRKSLVLDAADPNTRSAGSFFMNPILTPDAYQAMLEAARRRSLFASSEEPPVHALPGGLVKIPAAWLIERSGFARGFRRSRVGLSPRHALVIVNLGGATAKDVIALARDIRDAVESRFKVRLSVEPEFVGSTLE